MDIYTHLGWTQLGESTFNLIYSETIGEIPCCFIMYATVLLLLLVNLVYTVTVCVWRPICVNLIDLHELGSIQEVI